MIVIFGRRLAGTVDRVGNLLYVRTQFLHVYWIPLVPLESYVILAGSESGNGFKGVRTRLALKSVLFGWLRTALVFGVIGSVVGAVFCAFDFARDQDPLTLGGVIFCLALAAGCVLFYWLSVRLAHASYDRAMQIAEQLGIKPEVIDQCYGIGPTAEADDSDPRAADYER
jgi:hypothetical protein